METLPILLVQLQRMGDLVLSFPLVLRLRERYPNHPLWLMAEPQFYRALMPLTPDGVTYMDPSTSTTLVHTPVHQVINLSHRDDAAILCGQIPTAAGRTGLFRTPGGALYTKGVWALYRASVVHNNRHNLFHWADMPGMDVIPPRQAVPNLPCPRSPRGTGRVGLFVGASEAIKRPDPAFWGALAKNLAKKGLKPVFLGGPEERLLAEQAVQHSGLPATSSLAGQLTIAELATFMTTLDLLVTPDTGPMHIAAWAGALTLTLSMGTVNAWETAPPSPGHWVLRSTASCTGCWQCSRPTMPCRRAFAPGRIANVVAALLRGHSMELFSIPGLMLLQTARQNGLFTLQALSDRHGHPKQRLALGRFWQHFFLNALGGAPCAMAGTPLDALLNAPVMADKLRVAAARLNARLANGMRHVHTVQGGALCADFPPLIRPLSGYLDLLLANGEYQRPVFEDALSLTERLAAVMDGSPATAPLPLASVRHGSIVEGL